MSMFRAFANCEMATVFVKPFPWAHSTGHDLSAQCSIVDCANVRVLTRGNAEMWAGDEDVTNTIKA